MAEPMTGVIDTGALDALREMTGDDPAFMAEMIDAYFDDTASLLAAMRAALAAGDVEVLRRAAHSLKSNSATFGALGLSRLCRELEERGKNGALDGAAALVDQVEAAYGEVEPAPRSVRPAV